MTLAHISRCYFTWLPHAADKTVIICMCVVFFATRCGLSSVLKKKARKFIFHIQSGRILNKLIVLSLISSVQLEHDEIPTNVANIIIDTFSLMFANAI